MLAIKVLGKYLENDQLMQANFKADRDIIDSLHLNDYFKYEIWQNKDKPGPAKQQASNFASTQLAVLLL